MNIVVNRSRPLDKASERLNRMRAYQQAYAEEVGFIPQRTKKEARWYHHLVLPLGFLGLIGLVFILYWAKQNL